MLKVTKSLPFLEQLVFFYPRELYPFREEMGGSKIECCKTSFKGRVCMSIEEAISRLRKTFHVCDFIRSEERIFPAVMFH